ncbi:alpha 1,2-mannosyltransferase [Fistulifera solaris]|uniref:Alpha 1,2-mannosyltransferase n=1 Tax=Fistulifera solaris TaxID=1519565 RepID=A0A1Z5JFE4_FISSO|nr:alpha 1,2-mannosyltransferase [Fistulifera solaris]|eukprot:GAX12478.1 alpha 1,2-mannosyltransferase [Fistulifera solaris]
MMKSAARRMKSPSLILLVLLIVTVAFVNLYLGYQATIHRSPSSSFINKNTKERDADNTSKKIDYKKEQPQQQTFKIDNDSHSRKDPLDSNTDDDDESFYTNPNSLEALRTIPKRTTPTHRACEHTQGVYHIQMGDIGGAAGTIFFQFVVSQILYAEHYNLTPWVHFNNVSHIVYDPLVHQANQHQTVRLNPPMQARNATYVRRPGGHMKDFSPGPPDASHSVLMHQLNLTGTGVWEHYFEPISDYIPGDTSCHTYVTMDLFLITPGLHGFTDYAPRCWRYHYLPDYVTQLYMPFHEWIAPQRATAARVVQQYIRLRAPIRHAAALVNPPASALLGLHIRHSDKAAGRRVLETSEFLPYVLAFAQQQNTLYNKNDDWAIYLATDSDLVLQEIQNDWPSQITSRIRTFQALRSTNATAVFDMPQHHRHQTNTEVLIEIQALSQCHYLLHGLSAVSESALWLNSQLVSVDLEDPDERLTVAQFRTLLQMRNQSSSLYPTRVRTDVWWEVDEEKVESFDDATINCSNYKGILLIQNAGGHGFGRSFFTAILNQLRYAEEHQLLPWVHLDPEENRLVFDPDFHGDDNQSVTVLTSLSVTALGDTAESQYPGPPEELSYTTFTLVLKGNGIWNSYFEPLRPSERCRLQLPLVQMGSSLVTGLELYDPSSIRAWHYDEVTSWSVESLPEQRQRAHSILQTHFRPLSYLQQRVERVPDLTGDSRLCLGVHIRNIDKEGKYRKKIPLEKYMEYIRAFAEAGGHCVYVATDSRTALNFLNKQLENENVTASLELLHQGNQVVRSLKGRSREWLPHFYASHHRVNAETLVDILALARCQYLLHGASAVSEAAMYWNPNMTSISLEDSVPALAAKEFSLLVGKELEQQEFKAQQRITSTFVTETMKNTSIVRTPGIRKNQNAIVYLAQKTHSSYEGRDSYSNLLISMQLLKKHYLDTHDGTADVFVFHSGDFTEMDWNVIQDSLKLKGILHLVDLTNSSYWTRPIHHLNDNPADWFAWPLFSEGYRRMMHWFAIDIWEYFSQINEQEGCRYRYIWRLDEDSFIHSPIRYDIFDYMSTQQFVYGFRMCAYEMKVTQRMWTMWTKRHPEFKAQRPIDLEMCGIYNNFFVADLEFFTRPDVAQFLRFIDRQGHIYRRRLGDLMIHSMAVYAFAPPQQIHRFLDFTYEHGTVNRTDGCLVWGGIQAGYDDDHAAETLSQFYDRYGNCSGVRASYLGVSDLSPSYSHVSTSKKARLSLFTVTAGEVELPAGKGMLSG